jgi:hypothetical protein
MKTRTAPLLSGIVALLLTAPAMADSWTQIGLKTIASDAERDTFTVRGNDRHRQIRICAVNRPIRILDLDVRFANGQRQDIEVRSFLNSDRCTTALDLRGSRRSVEKIYIAYARIEPNRVPLVRIEAR